MLLLLLLLVAIDAHPVRNKLRHPGHTLSLRFARDALFTTFFPFLLSPASLRHATHHSTPVAPRVYTYGGPSLGLLAGCAIHRCAAAATGKKWPQGARIMFMQPSILPVAAAWLWYLLLRLIPCHIHSHCPCSGYNQSRLIPLPLKANQAGTLIPLKLLHGIHSVSSALIFSHLLLPICFSDSCAFGPTPPWTACLPACTHPVRRLSQPGHHLRPLNTLAAHHHPNTKTNLLV